MTGWNSRKQSTICFSDLAKSSYLKLMKREEIGRAGLSL